MQHIQYLRFGQISKLTGLSKPTIDRLERVGKFPKRRKISARAVGWNKEEVDQWLRDRARASDMEGGHE